MAKNPKLTQNEIKVLKKLIEQARVSDTEIAKNMSISQQAVYQIRNRLEELGVIKGYMPIIDFKKIGINLLFKVTFK
ncbi:MAG: helix-turn-helix domain-containing protein [Nanoarchaeota archaeon]|nr:helix-turn-helix domain-containing protein [Nanoarchaeota archaeon]